MAAKPLNNVLDLSRSGQAAVHLVCVWLETATEAPPELEPKPAFLLSPSPRSAPPALMAVARGRGRASRRGRGRGKPSPEPWPRDMSERGETQTWRASGPGCACLKGCSFQGIPEHRGLEVCRDCVPSSPGMRAPCQCVLKAAQRHAQDITKSSGPMGLGTAPRADHEHHDLCHQPGLGCDHDCDKTAGHYGPHLCIIFPDCVHPALGFPSNCTWTASSTLLA